MKNWTERERTWHAHTLHVGVGIGVTSLSVRAVHLKQLLPRLKRKLNPWRQKHTML